MLHCSVKYSLSGLRFLPVTVNQNLASAHSGGIFIFTKTGIWNLILWLDFLALKNTQRYRILMLKK